MIHASVINGAFNHGCFATLVCPIFIRQNTLIRWCLASSYLYKLTKRSGGMRFFCSFIVPPRGEPVSEQTQESKSSFRGDKARTLGEGVCGGEVLQGRGQRSLWERPGDGESVINHQTTPKSWGFPAKVARRFTLQNTKQHHPSIWLLPVRYCSVWKRLSSFLRVEILQFCLLGEKRNVKVCLVTP